MTHAPPRLAGRILASAVFASLCFLANNVDGADDAGRGVYVKVCQRCHGLLTERTAWHDARVVPVIALPQGPNLSGVVGRPVGAIKTFRYSNAMQALAATGAVWEPATLDQYLTDTQKFVRGSYMILKVAQPQRQQVIEYLNRFARHRPDSPNVSAQ